MRSHLLTLLSLGAALTGCAPALQGGPARDVSMALPDTYEVEALDGQLATTHRNQVFSDPNLVALIDAALVDNQELTIVTQEIRIANAELKGSRAEWLPQVGLAAGADMEKVGRYTSQGAADEMSEIEPGKGTPENLSDFGVRLTASWEIDIWKKMRNATKAARMRYLSSIEGRNFLVTGLVAEIAHDYYELIALDNELLVVEENLELLRESRKLVQLQKDAAKVTELAVQRFDAEVYKNEARRFDLLQRIVVTENHLNLLCGRYPQHVERSSDTFFTLTPPKVGAGDPGSLLEQRPDVRGAELDLEAAKLDVKVARARFYPTLSLDADLGYQAYSILKFGATPESLLYNVAAGLLAPLFGRAEINAGYQSANARQMSAVVGYERTVLQAYTEVRNQLSQIHNQDQAFDFKQQRVARMEQAIDTSNNLFRSARADYLEVLTTRRDALESKLELIETRQRQLAARVDLYRALGGGWQEPETSEESP